MADFPAPKPHVNGILTPYLEACILKNQCQCTLINRFEKSTSKLIIRLKKGTNHNPRDVGFE